MSYTVKILPSDVGPKKPLSCDYCNCDETCVSFNLLGQPLELWKVAAGLYAAGMYRVACKHKTTGVLRDVGGLVDVGEEVLNYIPGNVVSINTVEEDPKIKKFVVPALAVGSLLIAGFIVYTLFFRKK